MTFVAFGIVEVDGGRGGLPIGGYACPSGYFAIRQELHVGKVLGIVVCLGIKR